MLMTFFTMFDVPVFWPILLLYWLLLFTVTMKRQIKHMIKYRYLPFSTGKKVCVCGARAALSSRTYAVHLQPDINFSAAQLQCCRLAPHKLHQSVCSNCKNDSQHLMQ